MNLKGLLMQEKTGIPLKYVAEDNILFIYILGNE
jgi:hypothetical protein